MPDYQNGFGMTAEQIARDARVKYLELYAAVREAAGGGLPKASGTEWSSLEPSLRAKWVRAVETLFEQMLSGIASMSARSATQAFLETVLGAGAHRHLHRILQLVWEAVLRYAINLVQAGQQPVDGPPAPQHELEREFAEAQRYNWREWVMRKWLEEQGAAVTK